jgi:hypothetical protein
MNVSFPRLLLISVLAAATLIPGEAHAAAITHAVNIQVYQLCDDAGLNCAPLGPLGNEYFATETNKIWSQAGIGVWFTFAGQINSTLFSNLDDNVAGSTFADLHAAYGSMGPSTTTVDMFLVHSLPGPVYGYGWIGFGGIVIAMTDVMNAGRIDTIAHELGHNFGLVPVGLGGDVTYHSPLGNFLMASGDIRTVPATVANIAPDGLALDFIPAVQGDFARESSLLFAVPEPSTFALAAAAVLLLWRRRPAL